MSMPYVTYLERAKIDVTEKMRNTFIIEKG